MPNYLHQALEPSNERTILDYLNEDCWQEVLKYVHVRDIIRTESTSRQWQRVVLRYLSTTHISIRQIHQWQNKDTDLHNILYITKEEEFASFECWSRKLGHAVVAFKKCGGGVKEYMVLRNNCPNLKILELENVEWIPKQGVPTTQVYFPKLKRLRITSCIRSGLQSATDDYITPFITNDNLEELEIFINNEMTGLCLINIRSIKLKSLVFRICKHLSFESLVSISDRLGGLTKFVLTGTKRRMHDQFHLILDKMPKLEHLTIQITDAAAHSEEEKHDSNVFYNAVCKLTDLEHLGSNFAVWDRHLEQITKCCKKLKTLKLVCAGDRNFNAVTSRGMDAIYRNIGENLECLDFQYRPLDIECSTYIPTIYACPKLKCFRVDACVVKYSINELAEARREMRTDHRLEIISAFSENDDPCDPYVQDPCDHHHAEDVIDLEYISDSDYNDSDWVFE